MSENSPFAIRLRLLELSKEILFDRYITLREAYDRNYERDKENGKNPRYDFMGETPSTESIIKQAEILNDFVSNGKRSFK